MTEDLKQTIYYDPASVAGKAPPINDETDILIVGAGPAGLAAALAAAGHGLRVTLVDENPVPLDTMGEEIPLHFGGRMGAAVANHNSVLQTLLDARPEIAEALEAGVDVRLGTAVWGLFPQQRTTAWIEGAVAGLADAENAWLLRFKQVIVAAGRRDMGLAFDGWHRPGVMGVSAAHRLATVYGALECQRAVLIGSDTQALATAHALISKGVQIAAIIEQAVQVSGNSALLGLLVEQGAQVLTGHVVREAAGDAFGVKRVIAVAVDSAGRPVDGSSIEIECDTVLLGVAAIPAIELVEAAGCSTSFQADRGGHVSDADLAQRTSLPFVMVAGDCAGVWASKSLDDNIARREGRIAAQTALAALGVEVALDDSVPMPDEPVCDIAANRTAWVRASTVHAQNEPFVCLCEEVTASEILGQQPPRYLDWTPTDAALKNGLQNAAPNPDVTKRLTRACMGPCQGRRCREQVATLLGIGAGLGVEAIALASYRPPVRPLSLQQAGQIEETPQMRNRWDAWFDMPSQWTPFWLCTGQPTMATRPQDAVRPTPPRCITRADTMQAVKKSSTHASVVIVGGGVTGLSAAWWLARDGVDVLVLEAGLIGWGASGRNGGGCSHHHSPLFVEEQRLWPMMDELLGYPTEYRPDRISIDLTEHQVSLDTKVVAECAHYGLRVDLLDPQQVRELVPFAGDNVLAGFYYHFGGHANPHRTLQAYAWALKNLGGRILEHTPVVCIERQGERVTGVRTAQGLISCDHLVIAAGPHTGVMAAQLGLNIPLVTARAEMIVTEPLPLIEVGGVDGNGLYGRQTLRGNLAYGGGPHEWVELADLRGTRAQSTPLQCNIAKRLAELFPKVAHKRVIRSWAGFIENTPDGRPIIDRPAALDNVTVATMSGVGFGLSPASGHAIRDLVVDGTCSFADLSTFSLSRFAALEPDWQAIQGWLPLPSSRV